MINNTNNFKIIKNELNRMALLNMIQKYKYAYPSNTFCKILSKLYQNHFDTEYYDPIALEYDDNERSNILILRALQDLGLARTWESAHTNQGIEQQAVPTDAGFQFLDHFLGMPKEEKARIKRLQRIRRILSYGLFSISVLGLMILVTIELFVFATGDSRTIFIDTINNPIVDVAIVTSISLLLSSWINNKLKILTKSNTTKDLTNHVILRVREDKMLLYLFDKGLIQHQLSQIDQETLSVINKMLFDP